MVDHQNSHPTGDTGKLPPWAASIVNVIALCVCATEKGDRITMPDLLPLVHSQGKFCPLHLHNPDPAAEDKLSRHWKEGIQSVLVSLVQFSYFLNQNVNVFCFLVGSSRWLILRWNWEIWILLRSIYFNLCRAIISVVRGRVFVSHTKSSRFYLNIGNLLVTLDKGVWYKCLNSTSKEMLCFTLPC